MLLQLGVLRKDLRANETRVSLIRPVDLQVLEYGHRVLRLERTQGTFQHPDVLLMSLPEMKGAMSPRLLFPAIVTALKFTYILQGRVAFEVNVSPFWTFEFIQATLNRAPIRPHPYQLSLELLQGDWL